MTNAASQQRKLLDRWARWAGHADFDTYIRTGGSILTFREALLKQRAEIDEVLAGLGEATGTDTGAAVQGEEVV
jgi:hypothetical protein